MRRKDVLRMRSSLEQLESRTVLSTFFVAPSGNDSSAGTQVQPFRTITHGIGMLAPGDTLLVRGGTYAESLTTWKGGTSWSSPVTVAAYPGEAVTIKPGQGAAMALDFRGASTAYIIVRGFTIDASNVAHDAIKITANSSGAANHIRISNCEVENAPEQGILTTAGAGYNEFIGLNVHNNGAAEGWHGHGLYLATPNNLTSGCKVHDNQGFGITVSCEDSLTACDGNIVSGNTIYNNARAGHWGGGIELSHGHGIQAFNNVIYGNDGGIQIDWSAASCSAYNNTIYANQTYGIYVGPASTSAVVRNNIVYGTVASKHAGLEGDYADAGIGTVQDHNLIGVDPMFVAAASADFHLRPGSPAIDAGATLPKITTDLEGRPRPLGKGYDVGALECY